MHKPIPTVPFTTAVLQPNGKSVGAHTPATFDPAAGCLKPGWRSSRKHPALHWVPSVQDFPASGVGRTQPSFPDSPIMASFPPLAKHCRWASTLSFRLCWATAAVQTASSDKDKQVRAMSVCIKAAWQDVITPATGRLLPGSLPVSNRR